MKNFILFLFLLLSTNLVAQNDCSSYSQHITAGDEELQKGYEAANFEKAINSYATAMFLCPEKADEARAKIVKAFKDFGRTGFVKIKGGNIDYLIDKKGKEYPCPSCNFIGRCSICWQCVYLASSLSTLPP